jgi:hypothetical protein
MKYRIHLWQHPQQWAEKDEPPRARMRGRLNELFAAYRPKRSKDRRFHELEVAAEDEQFPRLLEQFRREVNRTAGVGGFFDCSLAPAEIARARFLQLRVAGDTIDDAAVDDWDAGRLLNAFPALCRKCRWPKLDKVPRPFLVSEVVADKPTQDLFSTSVGFLVVRERVAALLRAAVGDQIELGPARIAGRAKSAGLFFVRPLARIGADLRARVRKRCETCGRPVECRAWSLSARESGRLNDYRDTVASFGEGRADLALFDNFYGVINGGFYVPLTMSGALFAHLKSAGVNGLSVTDNECWFSAEGDAPLERAARSLAAPRGAAKAAAARETRVEAGRAEVRRLRGTPWDHHADGHVYFHLSTPRVVVADPMLLAGGGITYRVKGFAAGVHRLPVAAIKGISDNRRGVDVDSASMVFVDEAYFDRFVQVFDWDDLPDRGRARLIEYLERVAEEVGSRFGYCSAVVGRRWRSDFGGDGGYEIDVRAVERAGGGSGRSCDAAAHS